MGVGFELPVVDFVDVFAARFVNGKLEEVLMLYRDMSDSPIHMDEEHIESADDLMSYLQRGTPCFLR